MTYEKYNLLRNTTSLKELIFDELVLRKRRGEKGEKGSENAFRFWVGVKYLFLTYCEKNFSARYIKKVALYVA